MRTTQHSARIKSSARHNDRDFDTAKASHIDTNRTHLNEYYNCYDDMTFKDAERKFYKENFAEMIADINERAKKSRHPERMTNVDKLLTSKKTMPEEVILQIGNKDNHATAEQLISVFDSYRKWHDEKFWGYVHALNVAVHLDEATPHIHIRQVWMHDSEKGFNAIGQHKALEQLGYTLPDPAQPRGRRNNLKMVYTAECREKWLEICREHGLELETEPEHRAPNEGNLQKGEYQIQQQEKKLEILKERNKRLREVGKRVGDLQKSVKGIDLDYYKAIEYALNNHPDPRVVNTIQNALDNLEIWANKDLEEIRQDLDSLDEYEEILKQYEEYNSGSDDVEDFDH